MLFRAAVNKISQLCYRIFILALTVVYIHFAFIPSSRSRLLALRRSSSCLLLYILPLILLVCLSESIGQSHVNQVFFGASQIYRWFELF